MEGFEPVQQGCIGPQNNTCWGVRILRAFHKLPSSFSPLNPHYANSAMHLAIATVATTHPTVHAQRRPGPNRQSAHCAAAKRPCEEVFGVQESVAQPTPRFHLKTAIKTLQSIARTLGKNHKCYKWQCFYTYVRYNVLIIHSPHHVSRLKLLVSWRIHFRPFTGILSLRFAES